ncbi:MAG: YraN family protein [candidate division Zixibacteria bacterium]|nr:YraN family protein [candidate division Zixibacteria bacterium]
MPIEPANRYRRGRKYEKLAVDHLRVKGYDIVATNYRHGRKEIDIICAKDNELVFVEVKGGRSTAFGDPVYRVNNRKRDAIVKVAQAFLQKSEVAYQSYRFDVIVVKEKEGRHEIEHLQGAFTA